MRTVLTAPARAHAFAAAEVRKPPAALLLRRQQHCSQQQRQHWAAPLAPRGWRPACGSGHVYLRVQHIVPRHHATTRMIRRGSSAYARRCFCSTTSLNPYDVLGVQHNCTDNDLKQAYRRAAMQWHPDRHGSNTAVEVERAAMKFKQAAAAYESVSEQRCFAMGFSARRQHYHHHRRQQPYLKR